MRLPLHEIAPTVVNLFLLLALLAADNAAQVVREDPEELRAIDVTEKLGDTIPLGLTFVDDHGDSVTLARYFGEDRPVILVLGYYTCPMLCNLVLNGVRDIVSQSSWLPGREYRIVTVSIDPDETDLIAEAKKKNYITSTGKADLGIADGWAFLTGSAEQSRALADAVGFKYYYIEKDDEYAHPAVIIVLSPGGVISRYFYGIQFRERDVRLAMMDAADGNVGSTIDKVLLYCYHYDPQAGGYTLFAANIMRLGGLATIIVIGILVGTLWVRDRRRKKETDKK